ncbi:MAG: LytTR family DNA-binding domain-containing protein [Cyclobacteriaceae bacterium]
MQQYYLFGSRILSHSVFWLCYFLAFGFVWVKDGNYLDSYYLEFVLLPVRIGAVYLTLYWLMPRYLLQKKFIGMLVAYLVMLLSAALIQRLFTHFFYEQQTVLDLAVLLDPNAILRSAILVNTTVLFLGAIKLLWLYFEERDKNEAATSGLIEIKSEKRFYRVAPEDIVFIEGLGNYVTYHLASGQKIIRYASMKEALSELGNTFRRIHKSFIINKDHIKSYNQENVEILEDKFLPIGNSYKEALVE